MSRVMYNSKRLIPSPLVSFSKEYQKSGDGTTLSSIWNIQISGTIVAWKGSPDSNGVLWDTSGEPSDEVIEENSRLGAIFRKQEAIRKLFSVDGLQFECQSEDATQPIKCNPRVQSISFAEDIWYNSCKYTIILQSDILYVNGLLFGEDTISNYIESASENWSIESSDEYETSENKTFRLTHDVQAKGKRFFNDAGALVKPAWQQARDWVTPRMGFDNSMLTNSNIGNLPSYYGGFNHVRSEKIDELDGSYSIQESWLLSSGNAIETFDISTNISVDSIPKISINGQITGFENRDDNMQIISTKYANALTKFNDVSGLAITRCQSAFGSSLNVIPTSMTIGKNPIGGTISYSFEYDNRPSNLLTNTKSESITLSESMPTDFPVAIFVIGRSAGPVIQNLDTSKERRRTLNIDAVFNPPTGTAKERLIDSNPMYSQSANIRSIVDAVKPSVSGATVEYIDDQQHNWDYSNGRFSYNITWVYE